MEIIRNLNVNAEELFNLLEDSLKVDIKTCTDEDIENIEQGFSYTKRVKNKIGSAGDVIVTIEEFCKPTLYKGKIYSNQGFNYVTYNLKEIDSENTEVTYTEDFISDKTMNNMNFKIMSKVMKKQSEKKANRLISAMESYILDQKRNEEQECQD